MPLAERPLLDRWLLSELNTARAHASRDGLEELRRHHTRPRHPGVRRRALATGTCAAAGAASGRARATPTSWPPTTPCTSASSRSPSCSRRSRRSWPRSSTRTWCAAVDPAAPESVHLCAWPVVDEPAHRRRRVVRHGGRAARGRDGPRRAQRRGCQDAPAAGRGRGGGAGGRAAAPWSACARSWWTSSTSRRCALLRTAPSCVAYTVKPNLRVLGPQAGQAAGRAAGGAARGRRRRPGGRAARRGRRPGAGTGSVRIVTADGDELELAEEELLIETGSPEGYQVESDGSRTVALKVARRRGAARRGRGARAGPRHSARAQECRPSHRRHHQPGARRCRARCARWSSATRRPSRPRRWPASSSLDGGARRAPRDRPRGGPRGGHRPVA